MDFNFVGREINELSLLNEYVRHLPSKIAPIVAGHLAKLQNASDVDQIVAIKSVIDCLRAHAATTFDEFIGYVAFTVAISLIKHPKLLQDKIALISHSFGYSVCINHWNKDLVKISIIAKIIWKVCGSKLDNVRQIATTISSCGHFYFVTSILLISAAMNATTSNDDRPNVDVFCMYEFPKLLEIVEQLNSIDDMPTRLNKLNQFLILYTLYQSLVYIRKPTYNVNALLSPYFQVDKADFLKFERFLKNVSVETSILLRKQQYVDKCIALTEVIDFCIINDLEELIKSD